MATIRCTGKKTEKDSMLYFTKHGSAYGADIIRLRDKSDTGEYEEVRPCDFLVILHQLTIYVECKETNAITKPTLGFSRIRKGQWNGMLKAKKNRSPYVIIFQHLQSRQIYMVDSSVLLEAKDKGKKSLSEAELKPYAFSLGTADALLKLFHGRS